MARLRRTARELSGLEEGHLSRRQRVLENRSMAVSTVFPTTPATAAAADEELPTELPPIPVPASQFLKHVSGNPNVPIRELLAPFLEYENVLRRYLAQDPDHEFVKDNCVNLVSVFEDMNEECLKIRARDLAKEAKEEKEKYIMALDREIPGDDDDDDDDRKEKMPVRKKTGDACLVQSMKAFKENFNIFTEGSLNNLDWGNVIVAGSAVLTPMLVVPEEFSGSRRQLRQYYHETLAPASDIDLFIYGIDNEEAAIKKMEDIEKTVQDNLLWETTTIRTRNTITIVSQYPNRHVQIVLRLYKSISQILTGFDVNCSCFAYDGTRVLSNPRALAACITQCNDIDIRRRSPSYENRLSKYSHRGFEVYCDLLDRSRIDPTIYERSFGRTVGLARLLVLEALPTPEERDQYQDQRRREMGRPTTGKRYFRKDWRNKKEGVTDEVAEWDFEDVSDYAKFSIPYGEGWHARCLEKMFFKKDIVLNAEWNERNRPPHRMVNLHRHPVFFGNVKDVIEDCCSFCPVPANDEEKAAAEQESKVYVSGKISFVSYWTSDPGRQEVGSFYPLSPDDFTEQAYVGPTERLCEAIVNNDLDFVKTWCEQEGVDVNTRDFCGRTPLHLACLSTSTEIEIVQCLIDHGARLVARLQDGRTALHLAAARGRADMVAALLKKSAKNEAERDEKLAAKTAEKLNIKDDDDEDVEMGGKDDDDEEMDDVDAAEGESGSEAAPESSADDFDTVHMSEAASRIGPRTETTEGGFIKVAAASVANTEDEEKALEAEEELDDIYDLNVEDWDWNMNPLHHAVIAGHGHVVEELAGEWGADPRRPVKLIRIDHWGNKSAQGALLTLVFALHLPSLDDRKSMIVTLLKAGASSTQTTVHHRASAFHYVVNHNERSLLEAIFELDGPGAQSVIHNVSCDISSYQHVNTAVSPLVTAMVKDVELGEFLLSKGARGCVTMADKLRNMKPKERANINHARADLAFMREVTQPIEWAIKERLPADFIRKLVAAGADPSTVFASTLPYHFGRHAHYLEWPLSAETSLDYVRSAIEQCEKWLEQDPEKELRPHKDGKAVVLKELWSEDVLNEFPKNSYQRYIAEKEWKKSNKSIIEHNKNQKEVKVDLERVERRFNKKVEEVKKDLAEFKEYEKLLLELDAKTYHEKYPDIYEKWQEQQEKERQNREKYLQQHGGTVSRTEPTEEKEKKKPKFVVDFHFNSPSYPGMVNVQTGYRKLFDAVWRGDKDEVRALCLGATGEDKDWTPALQISICDKYDWTPLMIAAWREDYEMMDVIMEIVKEQYDPPKDGEDENSDGDEEDSGTDSDEDDPDGVMDGKPLADEDFVMDEPELMNDSICKVNVAPYNYFANTAKHRMDALLTKEEVKEMEKKYRVFPSHYPNWSILSYAIYKNNMQLVRKCLSFANTLQTAKDREGSASIYVNVEADFYTYNDISRRSYITHYGVVRLALHMGHIEMLEELMRTVSFGIFYDEWEDPDEETRKREESRYYQGLSVRGAKNKEWLDNSSPTNTDKKASDDYQKPLHIAVYNANMPVIEWLLSDRPWKRFQEYKASATGTKHGRMLEAHSSDLLQTFQNGLGVKTDLLPHICVMGWHGSESAAVLRFLMSRPGALEVRNNLGLTPALFAVRSKNLDAVKELIALGADFSVCDNAGRNVMHLLLVPEGTNAPHNLAFVKRIKDIISLLPAELIKECWTQRMFTTMRTPLAHYLHSDEYPAPTVVRMILDYSQSAELATFDSEGNMPVHLMFQRAHALLPRMLVEAAPATLFAENANGRTPVEISKTQYLKHLGDKNPIIKREFSTKPPCVSWGIDNDRFGKDEPKKDEQAKKKTLYKDTHDYDGVYLYALDQEAKAEVKKRKLVGLAEARELARRITTGAYKKDTSYHDHGDVQSLWDAGVIWDLDEEKDGQGLPQGDEKWWEQ